MLNFKKIIAAVMAVLMLALSFSVALADDTDDPEDIGVLDLNYASGTYQGYDFSLSTANGSDSLLWSYGTYGTQINMKLKFKVQLCYPVEGGGYANWGTAHTKTYGPFYDTHLNKSYTVSQWINAVNLSNVPAGSLFRKCTYSLILGSDTVASLLNIYV